MNGNRNQSAIQFPTANRTGLWHFTNFSDIGVSGIIQNVFHVFSGRAQFHIFNMTAFCAAYTVIFRFNLLSEESGKPYETIHLTSLRQLMPSLVGRAICRSGVVVRHQTVHLCRATSLWVELSKDCIQSYPGKEL